MNEPTENPFADPFDDEAIQKAMSSNQQKQQQHSSLDNYNPFGESSIPKDRPPSNNPPPYTPNPSFASVPITSEPSREDLLRRQEELERKIERLQRNEQNNTVVAVVTRKDNWPPFPKWLPCKPCFYQDFDRDIPDHVKKTAKLVYYWHLFYVFSMFLNVIICMIVLIQVGAFGQTFGLSIFWFFFHSILSLWLFRSVYNALRLNSSLQFFLFFIFFFFQILRTIIHAVGAPGWGYAGWMMGFKVIPYYKLSGILCFFMGLVFTLSAIFEIFLYIKVHRIYRSSNASMDRVQEEIRSGNWRVDGLQTTSTEVVAVPAHK